MNLRSWPMPEEARKAIFLMVFERVISYKHAQMGVWFKMEWGGGHRQLGGEGGQLSVDRTGSHYGRHNIVDWFGRLPGPGLGLLANQLVDDVRGQSFF